MCNKVYKSKVSVYKKITFLKGLIFLIFLLILPALASANPIINYTDILNGPNSGTNDGPGGCYLTIFGNNFGVTKGSSTVEIGGVEVEAYKFWSETKVSVQLGPSNVSGDIVLTTSEGSVTNPEQFIVNSGDIYFISPTGDDQTGAVNDINRPFKTPNYVVRSLSAFGAGDWVVARGGIYDLDDGNQGLFFQTWLRLNKSGSDNNDIVFMGYPGELADILIASRLAIFYPVATPNPGHFVVANFYANVTSIDAVGVIRAGGPSSGTICENDPDASEGTGPGRFVNIEIDGNDVGLMGCSLGCNAVIVGYAHDIKLLGISVHNSSTANENCRSHVIYLSTTQRNTEVGWSKVYNIPHSRAVIQVHQDSWGGRCFGQKYMTDINIHDNVIHNVKGQPILLDGSTGDVYIYNNIIYNAHTSVSGYLDIISLRGMGGTCNAYIYNNTIYVNPAYSEKGEVVRFGIMGYFPEHVYLYDNIFYVVDPQDAYFGVASGTWSLDSNVTSSNNLWYGSNDSLPPFANNTVNSDPMFIDPAAGDFSLHSGSPAKGAGRDGGDIGAIGFSAEGDGGDGGGGTTLPNILDLLLSD